MLVLVLIVTLTYKVTSLATVLAPSLYVVELAYLSIVLIYV